MLLNCNGFTITHRNPGYFQKKIASSESAPKKSKMVSSGKKVLIILLWNAYGIIHINILQEERSISEK